MYICPICNREFETDSEVAKHSLACWKKQNPYHQSKSAPRGEDITTREVDDNVLMFFKRYKND